MKPSDGRLIIGIWISLLAFVVTVWALLPANAALLALWPAWLLVVVLTSIALWLLEKTK